MATKSFREIYQEQKELDAEGPILQTAHSAMMEKL